MSLEDLKNRIKELPISQVLGLYVDVVQKGTRQVALCPFHNDSNPSLNVDDRKGMWYCFVDNIGGDAIKFVQLKEGLGFVEALKEICRKLGWNWDDFDRQTRPSPKRERGYKILEQAVGVYRRFALKNNPVFTKFIEERHLSSEVADDYSLGHAPPQSLLSDFFHGIKDEKERMGTLRIAEELGLIRKDKYRSGRHYDAFKNRIVFPIWDAQGRTIGFTGRTLKADPDRGKYINSSESFLFKKNQLLYGFHLARNVIREKDAVILVEGHMDKIALAAYGFKHAVAIMGTALGDRNPQMLLGLSKNIYLAFDNDEAGKKAAERVNAQFMERGILPKYVDLSPHKDPDDMLRHFGSIEFQKRLDEAKGFLDVRLDSLIPDKIPELSEKKLDLLYKAYGLLRPLGAELVAKEKIVAYAKRIGLQSDSATILEDYQNFLSLKQSTFRAPVSPRFVPGGPREESISSEGGKARPEKTLSRMDQTILQEVIVNPGILFHEEMKELLDYSGHDEVKKCIENVKVLVCEIEEGEYGRVLSEHFSGDDYSPELATFVGGVLWKYRPMDLEERVAGRMIGDIKRRLREDALKNERNLLKHRQKSLHTQEESIQLLAKFAEIDRKLNQLRSEKPGRFVLNP